ncbi:MAG: protein-glutamate O-methyltransferase [Alphaproteobacteria bacterium]|nr:protein-glutamate O-methyltransferase [Alphaproteobacteria bacterium]MBU1515841.1 protein-glutamate O-methyltransferase [Alphaproteobacteria bacterium]MBU2094063.1 protein-glutamate O-methyltransferase [Alphaproteobacteria bacterium]MBU2151415.1 protein-glutamate O-methyltransferase [Alphaproteobacteria bacterium]MBU2305309.1 protein-glutamate O-methyltransferase [Alphaproteobacteria bacterium]
MTASAPTSTRPGANMVDGEFAFTEADFRRISAMVHGDAGIHLPDAKATLVYSRLAKRLRALGLTSFKDYCALVSAVEGVDERQKMLAALTTNVTRFFREPHHFEHLKEKVLPPLLDAARRGGKVRIWSAACSSGQEPFSVAMTILSLMPEAPDRDIKILATDIDPNMVAEGRSGTYAAHLLDGVPDNYRKRWTSSVAGGEVRMADELRALVTFNELNLIGDWPMKGSFDAIFCRNVAIYFEDDTQARLWSRFAPLNKVGGTLYIGHSERIQGAAVDLYKPDGVTTYRRVAEAAR